ncbi:hypothetical protein [Bifidobacterium apicola]|uniref:hypothetical protein n=1 Tax=Bifidobacterium apicola TaxID=3230739 RepID=UPI0036F32857
MLGYRDDLTTLQQLWQQDRAGRLNAFFDSAYNKVLYPDKVTMMYHIIWLFMMQDRLALLHKLLADAGHLDFLG